MSTILVTGATSGIGRETALQLARAGHTVFATGRRQHALDSLAEEAAGLALIPLRLDVCDPDSIAAAVRTVDSCTHGHGLDILVNNAGYGQAGAVLDVDDALVRTQYDTNVFGLLAVTRAFADKMITRGSGKIVNISSLGGRLTLPMMGVYNSTKFAVESLSDALRIELAPFGVHVSVVQPGSIQTGFNHTMQATVQPERTGPWAEVYGHVDRVANAFSDYASGPEVIARVVVRIAGSRRPWPRYAAPFRETALVILGTWLPSRITDAVLARVFGVTAARPALTARPVAA